MSPKKRVLLLICIMAAVTIIVEVITVSVLYKTAIEEERARLEVTVKSQARLISLMNEEKVTLAAGVPTV